MNEISEFNLLHQFLGSFEDDVVIEPRGALEDHEKSLLKRIADGSSTDAERSEALAVLTNNTTALEFLAHCLKDG